MVINEKYKKMLLLLHLIIGSVINIYAQTTTDIDGDGITNDKDLCPNTPVGTVVNAYGCPINLSNCDYTTSSFSVSTTGVAPTETRYLLVNSATGLIEQANTTPTFTSLSGTNTYMVLAYSYTGTVTGLIVGGQLSGVSSSCQNFSNALVVKVCVAAVLPTVSIPATLSVNENAGTANIVVTLSSASTTNVTVNYATANGTAMSGSDYMSSTGTITFLPGEMSKTIIIPINDDTSVEGNETFTVTLSGATGATIGSSSQTTVSIIDNDVTGPTDSDGDGVTNDKDLCPNTPVGTSVNAYGCPINLSNCDYNASSFTLNSTIPPAGKETRYILADAADGKIVQISNTPSFSGLTGTKTYMVLAFSYENDNTLVNLNTNNYLNQVSAACSDWSDALIVKVCSPFIDGNTCDFTSPVITLSSGIAPVGATTKYVLVKNNGMIIQISNTPTFTGLSGTNNYNAYSISYLNSINNLNVGNNFTDVNGTCYDWSSPLSIKVCVCPPSICLPIRVTKIK